MRQQEHIEQSALFQWSALSLTKYPDLACMFAIPNGGKRSIGTAVKMKREGVKPGVPDIMLPAPRSSYHGMFIEMKAAKGVVTPIQRKMHEKLLANGYHVVVCYSMEHAKSEIILYLSMEKP